MTDLVISSVSIVRWTDKFTAPSQEAFAVGEAMRLHTDGRVTPANGTTAGEANFQGIATEEADREGQGITVVREGIVDVGDALDAMAFGDPIYLSDTDGTFATTAGTVSTICGRVIPGWGSLTSDKLFHVKRGG